MLVLEPQLSSAPENLRRSVDKLHQGPLPKHHGKQSKVIENSDIEDVPAEALALFLLDGRHAVTRV